MNIITKFLVGVAIASSLSGCAYNPSSVDVTNADYGLPPSDGYKNQIEQDISKTLLDPDSAKYIFDAPCKFWISTGNDKTGMQYGYFIGVTVNAKNSFGGYTGYQPIGVIWRNGNINLVEPAVIDIHPHGCI